MGSGRGKSRRLRSSGGSGRGWMLEETYGDGDGAVTVGGRIVADTMMHRLSRGNGGAHCLDAVRKEDGVRDVHIYPGEPAEGYEVVVDQSAFVDALSAALTSSKSRSAGSRTGMGTGFSDTSGRALTCRVEGNVISVELVTDWGEPGRDATIKSEEVSAYAAAEVKSILRILGDVEEREGKMMEIADRVLRLDPKQVGRVTF